MSETVSIDLKPRPDGYGFIYGTGYRGERSFRINVMPPITYWSGDFILEGYQPHPTDWVLYVDGEEIARVQTQEDVGAEFVKIIAEG